MIRFRKHGEPYKQGLNIGINVNKYQGKRLVSMEFCLQIGRYSIYQRHSYLSKKPLRYKGHTISWRKSI